jgi:hypothetical protein
VRQKLAKDVSARGEENARAAGFAPDTLISTARLRPAVLPGIECLVVDHQLAVQQIQLFESRVAMRWIFGSWREPHE